MIYPISLRLEANSDLLRSIEAVARSENKFGYVLSIVGDLSAAKFKCLGKKKATIVKDHLEIIALNGTISPEKCHLHISLSSGDCKLWSGHLEEGTIILKGADILLGFLQGELKKNGLINNNQKAEIFILPDCPWSSRAIRMLRTLQIPHDINVVENDNDFKILKNRTNSSSFPQIFIDGEFIGGYSELAELHASGLLSH